MALYVKKKLFSVKNTIKGSILKKKKKEEGGSRRGRHEDKGGHSFSTYTCGTL